MGSLFFLIFFVRLSKLIGNRRREIDRASLFPINLIILP